MRRINIIACDNGIGLSREIRILAGILYDANFKVTLNDIARPGLRHRIDLAASHRFSQKPPYDINIFLEEVVPEWCAYARINLLIPNQEWFRVQWLPFLSLFDSI